MPDNTEPTNAAYISSTDAASLYGCSKDYISRLCREGKLQGYLLGRNWFIEKASFDEFLSQKGVVHTYTVQRLTKVRKQEYREAQQTIENTRSKPVSSLAQPARIEHVGVQAPTKSPFTVVSTKDPVLSFFGKAATLVLAVGFVLGTYGTLQSSYPREALLGLQQTLTDARKILADGLTPAGEGSVRNDASLSAATTAALGSSSSDFFGKTSDASGSLFARAFVNSTHSFTSAFGFLTAPFSSSKFALASLPTTQKKNSPYIAGPSVNTVVVYRNNQVEVPAPQTISLASGISRDYVDTQLQILKNALSSEIFKYSSQLIPGVSQNVINLAQATRIDRLIGTTLTNVSVSGIAGLTDADIPDNVTASLYLPLTGGTLTGALTVTGNTTLAAATSSAFAITSISSGLLLKTTTGGAIIPAIAGIDYAAGNVAFPFTTTTFGATTANATSTLIGFTQGLYSLASSTIGDGTQIGGLTIFGGATTTGSAYFGSNVGIGSTSPWGLLSVNANGITAGAPQFVVGSSTATNFIITNAGNVGIGYASPNAKLEVSGGTGLFVTDSTRAAALVLTANTTSNNIYSSYNTGSELPLYLGVYSKQQAIAIQALTGLVGIGTTTPSQLLSVQGNALISGNLIVAGITATGTVAFNGGLTAYASSTIGNGNQNGGLTIFGGATTTGNAYIASNLGVSTTTFSAGLSVQGSGLFSTTKGYQGIGKLEVLSSDTQASIYTLNSRTSGSNYGVDAEVSGSGSVTSIAGYFAAANASTNYAIQIPSGYPTAGANNYAIRSDSAAKSYFAGSIGIGTTTPTTDLSVQGNSLISGTETAGNLVATSTLSVTGLSTLGSLTVTGNTTLAAATSTNFAISSIASGSLLKTTTGGAIIPAVAGVDYASGNVGYPFQLTGNATSTLTQFNGGLTAFASSTIGSGTQAGGLTIFGGATTTGSVYIAGTADNYFNGSVGIGQTAPKTKVDIRGISNTSAATLQIVGNTVSTLLLGQDADGGIIRGQGGNNALKFFTGGVGDTGAGQDGTEWMRISSAGRIGIGTTTPSQLLSVHGNQYTSGTAYFGGAITATSTLTLTGAAALNGGLTSYASSTIGAGGQTTGLTIFGGATTTGNLALTGTSGTSTIASGQGFTIGSSQFVLQQGSGNVGVGTASPQQSLHVSSATTYQGVFVNGNAAPSIGFAQNTATTPTWRLGIQGTNGSRFSISSGAGNTNVMSFAGSNVGIGYDDPGTAMLAINGNVGIGTTTPTTNFSVQGDSYHSGTAFFGGAITATSTLTLTGVAALNGGLTSYASSTVGAGGQTTGLTIFGGATTTGNAYFAGNVGIGTAAPGVNLHVSGTNANVRLQATANSSYSYIEMIAKDSGGVTKTGGILLGGSGPAQTWSGLASLELYGGGLPIALNPGASTAPALYALTSGNVGIGTTTPGTTLDVSGSIRTYTSATAGTLYFGSDTLTNRNISGVSTELRVGSTFANIRMLGTGGNTFSSETADGNNTAITLLANTTHTQGRILQVVNGNSTLVTIDYAGQVGIGTTTPTNTLAVHGTSYVSGTSFFGGAITATSTLTLTGVAALNGGLTAFASSTIGNNTQTTGLTISGGATTTGNAYFAGNVGIKTQPTYTLDVAGFINTDQYNGYKQAGNTILYASSTNSSTLVGIGQPTLSATALYNSSLGYQALGNATSTSYNTAIGYQALQGNASNSNSGANGFNTAVGYKALNPNSTGANNAAVGYYALGSNTTGSQNTAMGFQALSSNAVGTGNTAYGYASLNSNTGSGNTASGYQSLYNNTSGSSNVAFGYNALFAATSSTFNTVIGFSAGFGISGATGAVGTSNTLIGYQAGNDITTGSNNTILGQYPTTGAGITTGSGNILIGQDLRTGFTNTSSNQLNIGNLIFATGLGSGTTLGTGNVGIGTTTPNWNLQVAGTRPSIALSDTSTSADLKHWLLSSMGGNLYVGTSTDAYATSSPAAFAISNAGNVGIGSSTPGSKLVVSDAGGVTLFLDRPGNRNLTLSTTGTLNASVDLTLKAGGVAGLYINNSGRATIGSVASQNVNILGVQGNTAIGSGFYLVAAPSNGLIVEGNTGIGTTSPYQKLSVAGNVIADTFIATSTTASSFAGGLTAYASSTIGAGGQATGLTIFGGATTTLNAYFASNVGIGTTTPATNLSVTGNGYFTGGLGVGALNTTANSLAIGSTTLTVNADTSFTVSNPKASGVNLYAGAGSVANGWAIGGTDIRGLLTLQKSDTSTYAANTDMGDTGRSFVMENLSTSNAANQFANITLQVNPTGSITSGRVLGDIRLVRETLNQTNSFFLLSAFRQDGTYKDFAKIGYDTSYFVGNLGLGTTTPTSQLGVHGNSYVSGTAFFGGAITATSTLTLTGVAALNGGLTAYASSTIGNNTQTGGLTISGGATTTGNLALTGTTGTTTIASGQGFTIGTSQFVLQQGSGRVGIGTANPGALLDVNGDIYTSGGNRMFKGASWVSNAAGSLSVFGGTDSGFYSIGQGLRFVASGADTVSILSGGNMGIGTTSPYQKLSVAGNVIADAFIATSSTASSFAGGLTAYASSTIGNNTQTGGLTIFGGATTTGNAYIAGSVGIGVPNPRTKLHVEGTSASASATLQITGTNISTLLLGQDADGGIVRGQGGNNALKFYTGGTSDQAAGASGTEWMRITSAGLVGIGTTTPAQLLSVHGNGYISGTSFFGGAITATSTLTLSALATPAGTFLAVDATGKIIATTTPSGGGSGTVGTGTTGQFPYYAGSGTTLTATSTLFLATSGLVGIGTTTPNVASQLHVVSSSADARIRLGSSATVSTTNTAGIDLALMTPVQERSAAFMGALFTDTTDATRTGDLFFKTSRSGTLAEALRITGAGNVGIGTTTPSYLTSLQSDAPIIQFYENAGTRFGLVGFDGGNAFLDSVGGGWSQLKVGGTAMLSANSGVSIGSYAAGTNAPSSGLIISGAVGIGTSTPSGSLIVAGASDGVPDGPGIGLGMSGNYASAELSGSSGGFIDFTQTGTDYEGRILYDNATDYMQFSTNGAERFRVNATGMGIGTTSPTEKLSILSADNTFATDIFAVRANNLTQGVAIGYNSIRMVGTNGNNSLFIDSQNSAGHVVLQNTSGGKVGIGTTTPTEKLTVNGGLLVNGTANLTNGIPGLYMYYNADSSFIYSLSNAVAWKDLNFGANIITFGAAGTERARITAGGLVGIGTTTPGAGLDVYSTGPTVAAGVAVDGFNPTRTCDGCTFYGGRFRSIGTDGGGASTNVGLYASASGSGTANYAAIFDQGNVGIGNTTPTNYKLDVTGSIRSTTNISAFAGGATGYVALNAGDASDAGYVSWFRPDGTTRIAYMGWASSGANNLNLTLENGAIYGINGGNVGIGTSQPLRTLELYGSQNIFATTTPTTVATARQLTVGEASNNDAYRLALGYMLEGGVYKGVVQATAGGSGTYLNLNPSGGNVGIGTTSPSQALTIAGNVYSSGYYNLASTSGGYRIDNTPILQAHVSKRSYLFGDSEGTFSSIGLGDTFVGSTAGSFTTGNYNTGVGMNALNALSTGTGNAVVGADAARIMNHSYASVLGANALYGTSGSNLGATAIGYSAGLSSDSGSNYNTFLGYQAGYNLTTGSNNLILATATSSTAIANLTTGSQNILIGNNISLPSATASGQLNIGNIIFGTGITGTGSTVSSGNIGIGTTTPVSLLSVAGDEYLSGFYNTSGTTGGYKIDGRLILQASTTRSSIFVGDGAGRPAMSGTFNSLVGGSSGNVMSSGARNSTLGYLTLGVFNTSGSDNVAVGYQAAANMNYTGTVAVGSQALYGTLVNSSTGNTAVGTNAGYSVQTNANYNVLLGYQAGYGITTGSNNIWLGTATSSNSIANLTSGSQNILIGNNISLPSATASGQLNIGNIILGTGITGTGSTLSSGLVGIGTTTPTVKLTVGAGGGSALDGSELFQFANNAASTYGTVRTTSNTLYLGAVDGSGAGTGSFIGSYSNTNFSLRTAGTDRLTVTNAGNVGIGTTTPNAPLTVNGALAINGGTTPSAASGATLSMFYDTSNDRGTIYSLNNGVAWKDMKLEANSFSFISGASTQGLYQNSSGLVGIGTTSPAAKLAISGLGTYGSLLIDNTSTGSSIALANNGTPKTYIAQAFGSSEWTPGSVAGDLIVRGEGNNILFSTDSGTNTQLYLKNGGNVGIGQTSPSTKLQVTTAATGTDGLYLNSNVFGGNVYLRPNMGAGNNNGIVQAGDSGIIYSASGGIDTGAFVIAPWGSGTSGIRLTSAGNVGIGVTGPAAKLEVSGSTGIKVQNNGATTGDGIITFGDTGAALSGSGVYIGRSLQSTVIANALNIGGFGGITFNTADTPNLGGTTTPKMVLTSAGNVGIGTTTPEVKLSVSGDGINLGTYSDNTTRSLKFQTQTGGTSQIQSITVGATDQSLAFRTTYATEGERMRITGQGFVGIGTTSPATILHLSTTDQSTDRLRFENRGSGGKTWDIVGGLPSVNNSNFSIYDLNNDATRLTIDSSGLVGIGTTTPGTKLEVYASQASIFDALRINNASAGGEGSRLTFAQGTAGQVHHISSVYDATNGWQLRMGYSTNNQLNIDDSGAVGIGTTTPGSPLSVAGNSYTSGFVNTSGVTGGYKIDGNLILQASSTKFTTFVGQLAGNPNVTTASYNTALGYSALAAVTSGQQNTAVGMNSLVANQNGDFNTAVGMSALSVNTSGSQNVAIGLDALKNNSTASQNVAVGASALTANTTGTYNSALGFAALTANDTGNFNAAAGTNALARNITGSYNAALGVYSLYYNKSATSSTAVGYSAGQGVGNHSNQGGAYFGYQAGVSVGTGGDFNTLLGYQAGYGITTGSNNIWLGTATSSTGIGNLTTGSQNILIGNNISLPSATDSGQLNIGNYIYGTGITGTGSTISSGKIGIGTTTPGAALDIYNGALCVDDNTPTCQNAARTAGTIYAVATAITGIDLAERYPTKDQTLGAGEIVGFDPSNPVFVAHATSSGNFLGVVSTAPGIILGGYNEQLYKNEKKVPIALAGRVPVKVNLDGGDIAVGDAITLSFTAGVGMKATTTTQTIGIALEPYTTATATSTFGIIQVFIKSELTISAADRAALAGVLSGEGAESATTTAVALASSSMLGDASQTLKDGISALGTMVVRAFNTVIYATTGIFNKVFAGEVHTDKLCVSDTSGETCITKTQLDALLAGAAASGGGSGGSGSGGSGGGGDTAPDTEGPVINVNGANPATISVGDTYVDLGATVTDNVDVNLGYTVSLDGATSTDPSALYIDTSTAGEHTILYSATDAAGNIGTATRTVTVE